MLRLSLTVRTLRSIIYRTVKNELAKELTMSPLPTDYFPLTVATGDAFCNRVDEIEHLKNCIIHQRPILLMSPRRYGKTSLALQTMEKMDMAYANMDFFSVIDEQDIERTILKGVSKLISAMETIPQKALTLASEIFEGPHIRAVLGKFEVSIEIKKRQEKPAYHVLDILERLEKLAEKTDKKIILFMDEFQRIGDIAPDQAMESVLRQVAQLTKSISFIFSGSNRHLLNQLFEDRKRPFYKLCERITLDRISEEAYTKHIQRAAQSTWGQALPERFFERLFFYTERHPYYVNLLCSRIFRGKFPDIEMLDQVWEQYMLEERSSVAAEIELLSKSQRKLLTVLSRAGGAIELLGNPFLQRANMSKTTVSQAIDHLDQKDYVYRDNDGKVHVLDPLIKAVLATQD